VRGHPWTRCRCLGVIGHRTSHKHRRAKARIYGGVAEAIRLLIARRGASRRMPSDRDDRRRVQFVLGREQAVIELSNAGPSSTTPLGLPDDQATRLRSG
jgi:hypothetical protein